MFLFLWFVLLFLQKKTMFILFCINFFWLFSRCLCFGCFIIQIITKFQYSFKKYENLCICITLSIKKENISHQVIKADIEFIQKSKSKCKK